MHDFLIAFLGGLLLGIAVVGYLYVHGRIAGISGLIGEVINPSYKRINSLYDRFWMQATSFGNYIAEEAFKNSFVQQSQD